ncbi:MAG: hypothetical protein O2955_19400, partial [Planctomycetota bacterium]|nr:hypothetical protein [Planctomycetota bacterium]
EVPDSPADTLLPWLIGGLAIMIGVTAGLMVRYLWSRRRESFLRENRQFALFSALWIVGCGVIVVSMGIQHGFSSESLPLAGLTMWTDAMIMTRGLVAFVNLVKRISAKGYHPTLIIVLSFVILVGIGTALLMMPRSRVQIEETPGVDRATFRTAIFTATSASCVTGLVVVHTGNYWTTFGHVVIMGLMQIGGLGIMTFGVIFAIAAGRKLEIREAATFQNLLESDRMRDVPRMIGVIAIVTFGTELIGALLLMSLWPELPLAERLFQGVFHSVSAFCNAGFSLTTNSFVGMADRWQVWCVMSALIIVGGLGFAVNYNLIVVLWSRKGEIRQHPLLDLPRDRRRLTLSSKIVLRMTLVLLAAGMLGMFLLEASAPDELVTLGRTSGDRLANVWFQSVTCRTAGFNTVEFSELHPATKLFSIMLMFIGASPGSTGGGVKTTTFLLTILALWSLLQGRDRVEYRGRTIPSIQVNRALTIVALSLGLVMIFTLFITLFENQPMLFLDHMFEVTSAFGTVGLSTGITPQLSTPSQFVIILTMFIGRVGPLTLLIAMAGRAASPRYEFPEEKIALG